MSRLKMKQKNQNSNSKISRAIFVVPLIFVIVGISVLVASLEKTAPPISKPPSASTPTSTTAERAFDTPFFDALEEPLTLSSFKGQGLVVNFWATWCAPCVAEMPSLDRLAKKLDGSGVRVLVISEDRNAQQKVPRFFTKTGIENLEFHYDVRGALSNAFDVTGLPTTLLIDASGREVKRIKGATEWDTDENVEYFIKALKAKAQH